ncbi:MAG: DMT family transporter [Mycobacterium sp.]|nr:DMT family transporter [Mycobacterium sp.]
MAFAAVRVVAGAVVLAVLVALRGGQVWPGWRGRVPGVFGLVVYLVGFSWAYLALGAGVGALILFGAVQVTMFAGAVAAREAVPGRRWAGAGMAFAGLVGLVAHRGHRQVAQVETLGAVAMACAGFGWGIYSLAGRGARDALGATAWNFLLSVPVVWRWRWWWGSGPLPPRRSGCVWLAVVSGAVTSALGYALWYAVIVPDLGAARAGVAQLTVPMLAALGGALVIGEGVGLRFWLASALILGGVAVASRQSGLDQTVKLVRTGRVGVDPTDAGGCKTPCGPRMRRRAGWPVARQGRAFWPVRCGRGFRASARKRAPCPL